MRIEDLLQTIQLCEESSVLTKDDIELLSKYGNTKVIQCYLREIANIMEREENINSKILHNLCSILLNTCDKDLENTIEGYKEYIKFYHSLFRYNNIEYFREQSNNIMLECGDNFEALKLWRLSNKRELIYQNKRLKINSHDDCLDIVNGEDCTYCDSVFFNKDKMTIVKDRKETIEHILDRDSYDCGILVDNITLDDLQWKNYNNKDSVWMMGVIFSDPSSRYNCFRLRNIRDVCFSELLDGIMPIKNLTINYKVEFCLDVYDGMLRYKLDLDERNSIIKRLGREFRGIKKFVRRYSTSNWLIELSDRFKGGRLDREGFIKKVSYTLKEDTITSWDDIGKVKEKTDG